MSQFGSIDGDLAHAVAMPSTAQAERSAVPPSAVQLALQSTLQRDSVAYGWLITFIAIVLIRVAVFMVGVYSVATVHSIDQVDPDNASGNSWLAFDSHFYRYNLVNGYPPGPEIPYQIAYFPFLSVVSRTLLPACTALFGADAAPRIALLIVANTCAVVGLCFLYAWVVSLFGNRRAFISVAVVSLFPGAVFFCAALTEGPFMMFVAMALYLLHKQKLYAAAAVSAVATSVRPTAACLALTIILWTIYYSRTLPLKQLILRTLLISLISVTGGLGYEAFLWHRYQHIDAFKRSEDKWDLDKDPINSSKNQAILQGVDQKWTFTGPHGETLSARESEAEARPEPQRYSLQFFMDRMLKPSAWNRAIAFGLLGLIAVAFIKPAGMPRLMLVLPLAIWLMAFVPNWGLRCSSIYRYETAGLPLFVVIAVWLSAPSRRPLLISLGAIALVVQLYYAFLYSRGFWIG